MNRRRTCVNTHSQRTAGTGPARFSRRSRQAVKAPAPAIKCAAGGNTIAPMPPVAEPCCQHIAAVRVEALRILVEHQPPADCTLESRHGADV